ncbi:hypothetical protein K474DRAFT_435932 [Panus rudis PR-1116 ss-1]|nr:hypothetical protein K474DRAFT_435932 [Panus rudis PR-1116 ss-1]
MTSPIILRQSFPDVMPAHPGAGLEDGGGQMALGHGPAMGVGHMGDTWSYCIGGGEECLFLRMRFLTGRAVYIRPVVWLPMHVLETKIFRKACTVAAQSRRVDRWTKYGMQHDRFSLCVRGCCCLCRHCRAGIEGDERGRSVTHTRRRGCDDWMPAGAGDCHPRISLQHSPFAVGQHGRESRSKH